MRLRSTSGAVTCSSRAGYSRSISGSWAWATSLVATVTHELFVPGRAVVEGITELMAVDMRDGPVPKPEAFAVADAFAAATSANCGTACMRQCKEAPAAVAPAGVAGVQTMLRTGRLSARFQYNGCRLHV